VREIVSADDQVKAYIKKIMSQLDKWMVGGKISKLVIVITNKDTGEHVERWQFDVGSQQLPDVMIIILTEHIRYKSSVDPRRAKLYQPRDWIKRILPQGKLVYITL
jgi:hypothetical protein